MIDKPLQQNICNELLKKVYDKTGLSNPTFYQQKILISILAIQFKHFLQSLYLDPNLLDKNGKKKNNPNLYLIRAKIIDCFIQLTKHFTKGAYHEFLQKDSIYKSKKLQYEGNKANEKGLKDLSNKQKVSFKNINPSLLLFNQDGQSLSVVTTIKKNTKNEKELEEYQMFRDLINSSSFNNEKDLNDYERINDNKCFLEELVKILNIKKSTFDPEELKKKNLEFSTNSSKKVEFLEKYLDSFVFTADNFAKLILILLRIRARIPVILMGETGCGKTFLVRTMSKLYGSNLKILNIHAGITENDIISFLEKESLFQDSKNEKDKRQIWVFLDEINTCNAMGLISEIMIKNSAQGRLLNSNLIFIGACNPYREPLKQSNIYGLTIFNQPQGLKLVYTVNLLPHSLLNYVMDFGHLEPEDELKYIESMVTKPIKKLCIKYNLIEEISLKYQQQTIHAIQKCQNFLKENNDVSVVSLRELKRFVIFFEWFVDYLLIKSKDDRYKNNKNSTYFQLFYKNNSQPNYYLIIKLSINLAVYVCYYLRLPNSEKRNELNKLLSEILKEQSFIKFPLEDSMDIAKRVDIPKGTALNSAFLDNLYCSFVCINAKVPLIICGKPGCSKSFTIKILFNSLQGKFSNDYLFKKLPRVYITSYQGSKTNTSESVLFAFNKARDIIKKYQGNMIDQIISLLFFDEIGLAEKSENNPLKVIHSQLEYEDNEYKIAFIGISNWTLDASKMNRCVFLSINEPNENTLINTALSIAESFKDGLSKEPNNLKILTNLAKTFYQYKYDPFSDKEFFDFHGLRDFYHLIKCVCHNLIKSSNTRNIEISSIEKNLAGRGPSLLKAKEKYAEINNNNIKLISQNYNVLEIIKQNIINEEQNLTNLCNTQVNQTSNVYEQRFLLIFKESQNIHIIMESLMKELKKEYIFYIGSQFKKDKFSQEYNVKILSKIKQSCEEGKIIFLSDLDYLYPSYYDVFNQNYTIRDGKKYAKVIVETNESVQAYINDKTRFVLLFDTNRLNNYNTLPEIPLLNRFEKHILSYNDLIPPPTKDNFDKINRLLERMKIFESKINANEIILDPKDLFINCSAEEIQSILFEITKENEFQVDNKVFQKLSNLFPQDLLAILNILDISNNKPFINLIYKFCEKRLDLNSSLPKYLENTSYKKSIIYTFTPIIKNLDSLSCESEFDNKEKQNISTNTIHYITVNSISTEAEIEKILFNFYTNPIKNICFIKFSLSDIIHLQSIKNLIDNFEIENEYLIPNIKYKKIILIIYIQKYLTDEKYPENYKETVNKMKGKLIPHIVPDYDQIIIDNLFPQNEELNVSFFKYLNKNNKELIQLVDSETIFINEFNYCLEFIKYIECGQFPDKEIQNLTQYKQKLQNVIINNEDFKSLIKKLIVEMADKSESFIHSVFYKKNKAFTIYYISFLEVFHNYLKGQFIDLFIKVLCLLEIEVNCYSIIMNENCQNKKLKEFNQSQLKTFKSDNINNMSNEIFFYPGTKVFQSFKKIKSIQNALFSTIKAFIFYQNQIRNGKMKGDEDINDYNNIQEQIEKKLIAYFSKEYEDFQEEILYDYIKFYLCSNNLLETNFFEQLISFLIQQKFGSKDNIKLCDKIFWLEVNKDYVVQICLMYREFIDESKSNIPFFDDVKQTAIQIKEHNSEILEVNEGLFEISEALLEVLYKQNKINENINKLKVVCHSMKLLNEILKFNSEYLYKWEIIIESHEFFPDEEENIKFQKVIEEDNLDNFLQFIEDHYKKLENYDEFMINILQAECQRINNDNDENLRIIVNHIFKDFALVRKSKTILYLILYNTNENFELTSLIQSNEDEENDTKHNVFEKVANNVAVKKLFMYLEEQKDDKDYNKKYFIIENHFLFIFEIIAYDFFETLIKLSVKQSTGQEKKEKEASVISITEDKNNITFKLLEKAIIIIKESVNKEQEISKISFLYAISYIKIYLEFFIQFYNTHLEELGNHSDIIKEILNFGGESHTNLKKAIFYYILKLFDKNLNGFTKITERNWETWGENYYNFIDAYFENYLEYPRELDFPFFSNVENYNELQRKMNDSNIENNKENSREFINFIFNEYFSILTKTCDGNEYTHLQTIQTCFFNEDDNIWVCLNLLLLNDSNKEELVKNIEHLTQCDYVKLLHCFYFIVLILNEKGVDTLKSLYKELYNTFSNNKPILFDLYENIKLVFYFSFEFFKEYLPFIKLQENKNSTSDSPRNLLNKLIEYLREIETIIDSPIEIFFHLFYKNYIESFDIRKAFHETIKNLPQFTKTYQQDCQKLFKIEENDLKSIIREMINPLDYKDNEYLKYFLLSNTFTLEKRKENFMNLEMKDMFPLLFYLYSIEEDTTILQLKQLHNLNYFGREIFEYYTTNKLSKKLAESTEIENFLILDNEKQYKRTEYFKKFQDSWDNFHTLSEINTKITQQERPPNIENNSNILYCLPEKNEGKNGYHLTKILRQCMYTQNEFIDKIIKYLRTTYPNKKFDYLVNQLSQNINIQDAFDNDIINLDIPLNRFHFRNILDMLKFYSERKYFDNDGNFILKSCRNIYVDNKKLHEELIKFFLQGKHKFSETIKYVSFLSDEKDLKIQEDLNKQKENQNKSFINKMF